MTENTRKTIGKIIKIWIKEAGYTQNDIARNHLGISQPALAYMLNGRDAIPRERLKQLIGILSPPQDEIDRVNFLIQQDDQEAFDKSEKFITSKNVLQSKDVERYITFFDTLNKHSKEKLLKLIDEKKTKKVSMAIEAVINEDIDFERYREMLQSDREMQYKLEAAEMRTKLSEQKAEFEVELARKDKALLKEQLDFYKKELCSCRKQLAEYGHAPPLSEGTEGVG